MTIESAFFEKAKDSAGIIAALSAYPPGATTPTAALFPELAPPDALTPYGVYQVISTELEHAYGTAAAIFHARVQVAVYALTSVLRRAAVDAFRAEFDGFSGSMGATVALDVAFCRMEGGTSMMEPARDQTELNLYRGVFDFLISHR